jgi:uncharacterized protein
VTGLDGAVVVELAVILAAIALGSFVKGVTGSGLPQIAIPVMAVFLGVERAVVIMAIPGVVTNSWLLWRFRDQLRLTRDLPVLLVSGMVGAVIGTFGLERLDAAVLALAVAGMIGIYLALHVARFEVHLPPAASRIASPPIGLVAGAMQGATGMSGPLLTTYLHSYRLPKHVYVVSLVTLFQVYAVVQMLMLFHLGLYTTSRLLESLIALVPMMSILPLGARYASRISQRAFDRWVLALLAATAANLIYEGLSSLLR